VAFAVVLALVGVGCLIYFIHHVATSIQASFVVAAIAAETHRAIDASFPNRCGEENEPLPRELVGLKWYPVPAPLTGMLQFVDYDALMAAAAEHDVVLRMECRIGDFVVA